MIPILIADVKSHNVGGKSPGHYFRLAQNYVDMFEELADVRVVGGPVYKNRFDNALLLSNDTVDENGFVKKKLGVLKNCFELFNRAGNQYIVVQSNAVATVYIALLLSHQKNNIFMIQYNQFSINSPLKKLIYKLAKNKIAGMLCPTEAIGKAYGIPYHVISDYCVTKKEMEKLPKEPEQKKYDFGMVGLITRDKGIIEAAKKLAGTSAKVIIAGRADTPEIERELKQLAADSPNIQLELGYISDENYDKYIRQSRYCVLNYSDAYSAHSSGVVFDVLYRGTPVVGRMCETLRFIKDEGLGIVYDEIDNCDFEAILQSDKDSEYLNNLRGYLEKQLAVPEGLIKFMEKNRKF